MTNIHAEAKINLINHAKETLAVLEDLAGLGNWIFVAVTGFIAYHGITYRDNKGNKDGVRLLFGCIALLFCITIFAKDILKLW